MLRGFGAPKSTHWSVCRFQYPMGVPGTQHLMRTHCNMFWFHTMYFKFVMKPSTINLLNIPRRFSIPFFLPPNSQLNLLRTKACPAIVWIPGFLHENSHLHTFIWNLGTHKWNFDRTKLFSLRKCMIIYELKRITLQKSTINKNILLRYFTWMRFFYFQCCSGETKIVPPLWE